MITNQNLPIVSVLSCRRGAEIGAGPCTIRQSYDACVFALGQGRYPWPIRRAIVFGR